MTDAEKKRQLENKKGNLQTSAKSHQNSINNIDDQLKRLRKAKEKLYGYQKTMKTSVQKKDRTICDAKYKWKGNWYSNDFKRDMHKMLDAEKSYLNTLNGDIDKINNRITALEKELVKHKNILQRIWVDIKSVSRDLENMVN